MQSIVILSVGYVQRHLCWMSHKPFVRSVIMLNVFMLSVFMPSIIKLNVMAPFFLGSDAIKLNQKENMDTERPGESISKMLYNKFEV